MTTIIQAGKEMVGVKMFENKKAASLFIDLMETIQTESGTFMKNTFVQEVKYLFELKITSEDGEYTVYKITSQDLLDIAVNYKK